MSDSDAPNSVRPPRRWPPWRVILAYLLLAIIAAVAIWYIDRKAHVAREATPMSSTKRADQSQARAERIRSALAPESDFIGIA